MRWLAIGALAVAVTACTSERARQRYFANGQRHLASGDAAEAIIELRNAIGADENWGEARFLLAQAYEADGQPERAYREYLRAADLLPAEPRAQLKAAHYLLLARQFPEALVRARQVLSGDALNYEAHLLVAEALAGTRDNEAAIESLREAMALEPAKTAPHLALARIHASEGRHKEALAAYESARRVDPQSIDVHLALANYLWSRGANAETEATLLEALALGPSHASTHRTLADFYAASRRPAKAEQHLKVLIGLSDDPQDRFALADFYVVNRRLAEARLLLEPLTSHRRTAGAAETRLARIDDLEGNPASAERRLQRVLAQSSNYSAALVLKAERSLRNGNWQDALWEANAAIAADPRLVSAYYVRAAIELQAQRFSDAMRSYSEILRLNPAAVDAKVALSRLHVARNEVDSGVLYAEEALRNTPDNLDARLALIRAWLARGDDSLAQSEIVRMMQRGIRSPELFTLAGALYIKRHESTAARRAFERAIQADPTSREALTALTALDVGAGNFAIARERLDAALGLNPDDAQLLVLAAKVELARQNLDVAERMLNRALDADALPHEGFVLLTRIFQAEHRLAEAIRDLDARSAAHPGNQSLRLLAAVATHAAGATGDAERRYQAVLKNDAKSPLAANNLAAIYLERGENLDYAESLAASALAQLPDAEIFDTLGSIQAKRLMYGAAVKNLERAVALQPDNASFHYRLGLTYAAMSNAAAARAAFAKAAELDPRLTSATAAALASVPVR
jgi:tetratricopeptide (TPR) repeat protein